jgi:hypothetical protein
MKHVTLTLLSLFTLSQSAFSQDNNPAQATLDLGSGLSKNAWAPSILYHEDIPLSNIRWLRAGLGIRAWGYYGDDLNLISQAASSSANTLQYNEISVNGLSLVAGASVRVWRVDIGANTDLAGLAFGSKRNGYYPAATGSSGSGKAHYNNDVSTRPITFNVLPVFFNNYNGQSEVYGRIWLSKNTAVKIGYQFGQIAYLTRNVDGKKMALDGGERRFSQRYNMPYIALSFKLFQ